MTVPYRTIKSWLRFAAAKRMNRWCSMDRICCSNSVWPIKCHHIIIMGLQPIWNSSKVLARQRYRPHRCHRHRINHHKRQWCLHGSTVHISIVIMRLHRSSPTSNGRRLHRNSRRATKSSSKRTDDRVTLIRADARSHRIAASYSRESQRMSCIYRCSTIG